MAPPNKEPSKEMEGIEPVEVSFATKLKEDKNFVLALIDDPVKAFRTYGFNGDERMLSMLRAMSNNIHLRAIRVFNEILNLASIENGCRACDGCRACKACTSIFEEKAA